MENNAKPTSYNVNGESVPFLGIICCAKNKSTTHGKTNRDWWPNQLRLNILHQNSLENNPMGANWQLC
jgi:catalase-peroxidase